MDERREYAEIARETRSAKPGPRGGCGCLAWGVILLFFLLVGGKSIGVWRPLLLLPIFLAVAGLGFWALFKALRDARVRRGAYDPGNRDWHPLSVADATPGPSQGPAGAEAAGHATQTPAAPADAGPPGADPAVQPGAQPPAGPPPSPDAPPDAGVQGITTPAGLPYEPQAPQAPEAPASPWS